MPCHLACSTVSCAGRAPRATAAFTAAVGVTAEAVAVTATSAAVLDAFPDAIVNCAAVSVPEQCETDPARSQAMNVGLPATLARLAHHVSARFVHISSEQVFDGTRTTPYAPTDRATPINLYARQKLESERAVHEVAEEFAITLRVPLLISAPGFSASASRSRKAVSPISRMLPSCRPRNAPPRRAC